MITARVPLAAVGGVLCSLAVFLGLWRLVGGPLDTVERATHPEIDFRRQVVDTPIQPKPRRTKPDREPRPEAIDPGRVGPDDVERVVNERPDLIRISGRSLMGVARGGGIVMGVDRDALPLVRVNPVYPTHAEKLGIEGWVRVQFNVTATGAVRDAIVVAAEPRGTFDEAALEAVARWRYNPRVDAGLVVERVGLETLFRFTIEDQP